MELSLSTDALLITAACAAAILFGGIVKGTLGVGLPLLAVPIMSLMIGSTQAIALVAVPVLVSNIWQAWQEASWKASLKRFWPLMLTQAIMTVIAVHWTLSFSVKQLNMLVAFAVVLAVVSMLFKPSFTIPADKERWTGALVGSVSGMLGGVSSLMGPILISYMLSLKMQRDEFVGAVSVIYLNAAWPLYLAMYSFGRMEVVDLGYSVLALVPMAIGLTTGQKLRHRISEEAFRKILLGFLTFIAVLLVIR
ncbi:MAG: sulfite exporter TauE/SafE family protein [Limnohabitans sp.]|nr:sulfite exporter TauE/SafE family protein [Limnohabitans sp.]